MNSNFSNLIANMSESELREANTAIVDMLKTKRNVTAVSLKSKLDIGMTVGIDHPSKVGQRFEITKINRNRAAVKPLDGFDAVYSVPFSMLILDVKVDGKKATVKAKHLEAYLEEFYNFMRRACKQEEIAIPTDEESAKEVITMLQSHYSPENLTCDGELNRTEIDRRRRMIVNASKDLGKILCREIDLEDF